MNIEDLGEEKKGLKIITIVGDLLQGSILTILLLRPDLKTRSLLRISSLSGHLGLNLGDMGTTGNLYFVSSNYFSFPSLKLWHALTLVFVSTSAQ